METRTKGSSTHSNKLEFVAQLLFFKSRNPWLVNWVLCEIIYVPLLGAIYWPIESRAENMKTAETWWPKCSWSCEGKRGSSDRNRQSLILKVHSKSAYIRTKNIFLNGLLSLFLPLLLHRKSINQLLSIK